MTALTHFNNVTLLDGLNPTQENMSVVVQDDQIIGVSSQPGKVDADDVDRLIETQASLKHLYTLEETPASAVRLLESKGIDYMCQRF